MNLKHIGGVLTPGEEFVCFRCRVGWNGLNTRLARRNVQTEGQVLASLGNILDSVPIPSRTKKSTPGAAVPRPRTWEGKARRFISREFVAPEAAKDSQEEVSVATDALLLEQKFRVERNARNARAKQSTPSSDPLSKATRGIRAVPKRARAEPEERKEKVQGASQDRVSAVTPTQKKANSSKSAVKIEARDDVQKTEAKAAKIEKNSKSTESTVKIKPKDINRQSKTPGMSAKVLKKKNQEILDEIMKNTFTDPRWNAVTPVNAGESPANGESPQPIRADIELNVESRKIIESAEPEFPPDLVKKQFSSGAAADKSQQNVPVKLRTRRVSVRKSSGTKAEVHGHRPEELQKVVSTTSKSGPRPVVGQKVDGRNVVRKHIGSLVRKLPTYSKRMDLASHQSSRVGFAVRKSRRKLFNSESTELSSRQSAGAKAAGLGTAEDKSQDAAAAKMRRQQKPAVTKSSDVKTVARRRRAETRKARLSEVRISRESHVNEPDHTKLNIRTVRAKQLDFAPLEIAQPPVPTLSYGLDRVLFNPGVYHLQDQRSRVFNFDPYLQSIMPVAEFDFTALKAYITSSKDRSLKDIAEKHGKRYRGSSSSMTSALAHFHYLLSRFRKVNLQMLSKGFPDRGMDNFTIFQRSPVAIFLKREDGAYAIDADKEFDSGTILSHLGKAMEKLLTLDTKDYERYRKSNLEQVPTAEREGPETFHYSSFGDILMRSQLDAHDPRLPGTGMFDLKTRAVVSIRMDAMNHQSGVGYEIRSLQGEWESFEREYYDMIRSAFLKYSLQVRMGRMDGIFVAFHNVQRIFGFQYISLPEMDLALHGGKFATTIGDQEFRLSLGLLNQVLDRVTEKFPESSLRIHFEARETESSYMYIFVEPVTEDQAEQIQSTNAAKIREFEQTLLGLPTDEPPEQPGPEEQCNDWAKIEASVKEAMHSDELSLTDFTPGHDPSSLLIDSDDEQNLADAVEDGGLVKTPDDGHNSTAALEKSMEINTTEDVHEPSTVDDGCLGTEKAQKPKTVVKADFDISADAEFLDSTAEWLSTAGPTELCAWTLTVRNKVNGAYVHRPDALTSEDTWEVDYSLSEITDRDRAEKLYLACRQRRAEVSERSQADVERKGKLFRVLRELSKVGADRRKELDEAEKGKPIVFVDSATVTKDQKEGR